MIPSMVMGRVICMIDSRVRKKKTLLKREVRYQRALLEVEGSK